MGKYLVLGSNSFSGSNFCAWLLKHEHRVFATSRSNEAAYEFLPYRWQNAEPENFTFAKIDLNHDLEANVNVEAFKEEEHTPQLFEEESTSESENRSDDTIDAHTDKLFDKDSNEEEDFEIPAFLRKQKF